MTRNRNDKSASLPPHDAEPNPAPTGDAADPAALFQGEPAAAGDAPPAAPPAAAQAGSKRPRAKPELTLQARGASGVYHDVEPRQVSTDPDVLKAYAQGNGESGDGAYQIVNVVGRFTVRTETKTHVIDE